MQGMRVSLFAILLAAPALWAQTGSISGITEDDFGHPVAQVEVSAKNAATGAVYRAASGAKGEYSIGNLPAGAYDLSVVIHGAQLFSQKDISLTAGQTVKVDARMHEGSINSIGDNAVAAAAMENRKLPTGATPRTFDGHPDFTGVWATMRQVSSTPAELLPWAQAEMKKPGRMSPNAFCLPQGPKLGAANPFKIVQAPKTLVILNEDIFVYHQIHLDGREPPKDADPTWMGYSIGHWDDDTLVVQTTNFNDKAWLPANRPHTEQLKVTERFQRPDEGHLKYEITYDDPGAFTKPWTMKAVTNLLAGDEIGEYVCTENEQDIGHYKVN